MKTIESNRKSENCITIVFQILITWNLAIQLCLYCWLDPYQNFYRFWPSLDVFGILLFYGFQAMENNRKTMKTIEMWKIFYMNVIPLPKLRFWQSFRSLYHIMQVLQSLQLFATNAVFWPQNSLFVSSYG